MFNFKAIGVFRCSHNYHQEQPMQGVLSDVCGFIELEKGYNYEQGLKDLDGFDYIWLIFVFHHNHNWRPLTNPPYSDGKGRKGVFATRSPYRPNPVGMSCVKLDSIKGNRVFVSESDLLNDTPILDIKPYIPEFDSFSDASSGWLANVDKTTFAIEFQPAAEAKMKFLKKRGIDLNGVISSQLAHNPFDKTRNKFCRYQGAFLLRFKSWRIVFEIESDTIKIENIFSGYLNFSRQLGNDTCEDLVIHQKFQECFDNSVLQPV